MVNGCPYYDSYFNRAVQFAKNNYLKSKILIIFTKQEY